MPCFMGYCPKPSLCNSVLTGLFPFRIAHRLPQHDVLVLFQLKGFTAGLLINHGTNTGIQAFGSANQAT